VRRDHRHPRLPPQVAITEIVFSEQSTEEQA